MKNSIGKNAINLIIIEFQAGMIDLFCVQYDIKNRAYLNAPY
jgi:hypothetical protein